jgi:hypothetical protein
MLSWILQIVQKIFENQILVVSTTTNSIPIGVERVCKTDKVCGKISETKNLQTLASFGLLYEHQIVAPLLQQQQYFHLSNGISDFHSS